MIELGYLAEVQNRFKATIMNVTQKNSNEFHQRKDYLEKAHFDGAFVMLGLGLGLATIVFLIEILTVILRSSSSLAHPTVYEIQLNKNNKTC